MIKTKITDSELVLELTGWDRLWAFKGVLTIDLKHVCEVRKANKEDVPPCLRAPGTAWPGVITAGTYYGSKGRKEFWSTRHKGQAILLDLEGANYSRVVFDAGEGFKQVIEEIKSSIRA